MTRQFALDEQETTFTIEATDRSIVHVYSNDPVYQRKLERVGAMPYRDCDDGGKFYKLPVNQLRITLPPRIMTEEQRAAAAQRLRGLRDLVSA